MEANTQVETGIERYWREQEAFAYDCLCNWAMNMMPEHSPACIAYNRRKREERGR